MKKFLKHSLFFWIFIVLAATTIGLVSIRSVEAVSNRAPDPSDYSEAGDVFIEVARPNGGSLYAPQSTVVVYSKSNRPTISIYDYQHCREPSIDNGIDSTREPDNGEASDTTFTLYQGGDPTNPTLITSFRNNVLTNDASCHGQTKIITPTLTAHGPAGSGFEDYYLARLVAFMPQGVTGTNAFKVGVNTGIVSFTNQDASQFSIGKRPVDSALSRFDLKFAVPCNAANTVRETLTWFDDDVGQQQPASLNFQLWSRNRGSNGGYALEFTYNGPWSGNSNQGDPPRSVGYTFDKNKEYMWRWNNVIGLNGIQFSVPFNSAYAEVSCTPPQDTWSLSGDGRVYDQNHQLGYGSGDFQNGTINVYRGDAIRFQHQIVKSGTDDADGINKVLTDNGDRDVGNNSDLNNGTNTVRDTYSPYVYVPWNASFTANNPTNKYCEQLAFDPSKSPRGAAPDGRNGRGDQVCYRVVAAPMDGNATGYCNYVRGSLVNPNYQPGDAKRDDGNVDVYVTTNGARQGYRLGNVTTGDFDFDLIGATGQAAALRDKLSDGATHTVQIYATSIGNDGVSPAVIGTFAVAAGRCVNYALTPNVTSSTSYIEEDGSVDFNYTITKDRALNSKNSTYCVYGRSIPNATVAGTADSDQTANPTPAQRGTPIAVNGGSNCASRTFNGAAQTYDVFGTETVPYSAFTVGQKICRTLTVTPNNGISDPATYAWSTEKCVVIGKSPYVQTMGGDTRVGGAFPSVTGSCILPASDTNNGAILTSSSSVAAIDPTLWRGSGSEYGSFSSGANKEFGSKGVPGSLADAAHHLLTFANTGVIAAQNGGSSFGGFDPIPATRQTRCMTDYVAMFSGITPKNNANQPTTIDISAQIAAGKTQLYYTKAITLTASQPIPKGKKLVIVSDGTITITSNITYTDGYASVSEIPSLALISAGNMNVVDSVTRLDGLYSTKAVLNTCSNQSTATLRVGVCANQLVFNGVVEASKVTLLRTYGSQTTAGHPNAKREAGEVFNYSPALIFSNVTRTDVPNLVTSLNQKDLPARY
jgi:hypothetical protein